MTRIAAMIAGLVLIGCPAWWLAATTIPIPKYRTHGFADFLFLGQTLLAIYGSVLLGGVVHWVHANRGGQQLFPIEIFKAGMYGVLWACIVFFGGGGRLSLWQYGPVGGGRWGTRAGQL